jgi:hypothetical protein
VVDGRTVAWRRREAIQRGGMVVGRAVVLALLLSGCSPALVPVTPERSWG